MRALACFAASAICLGTHSFAQEEPSLVFSEALTSAHRTQTLRAFERATDWFETTYGSSVPDTLGIAGASTIGDLRTSLIEANKSIGITGDVPETFSSDICARGGLGAATTRFVLLFCWPEGEPVAGKNGRLIRSMVHEVAHQIHFALAQDRPARKDDNGNWRVGPAWLVEGAAEFYEQQFQIGLTQVDGPDLFDLQSPARRSRLTLADLQDLNAMSTTEAYGVARFAAYLLVQRAGPKSHFEYFRAIGDGLDQAAAFESAYGMPLGAFDAEFEALRRDYGAARRWQGSL